MEETLKERFEQELNRMFEPSSETPLWACIQLSGDVESHLQAMTAAYNMALPQWVRVITDGYPKTQNGDKEYLCRDVDGCVVCWYKDGQFIETYTIMPVYPDYYRELTDLPPLDFEPLPTPPNPSKV